MRTPRMRRGRGVCPQHDRDHARGTAGGLKAAPYMLLVTSTHHADATDATRARRLPATRPRSRTWHGGRPEGRALHVTRDLDAPCGRHGCDAGAAFARNTTVITHVARRAA